jgi:uncharacterized caspase-like protein
MKTSMLLGWLIAVFLAGVPSPVFAKKVALVIGIGSYENVPKLANPLSDASRVSETLSQLGFHVLVGKDLSRKQFAEILLQFDHELDGADTAAFYFAGHGVQISGKNQMIASDAELINRYSFVAETISLDTVLSLMKAKSDVSLVFLDACRDNPFVDSINRHMLESSATEIQRGLAPVEIRDADTIVMFAAAPNEVALDGSDGNSPFASSLVRHLLAPDTELVQALRRVVRDVQEATGGQQSPELLVAAGEDVYLNLSKPMSEKRTIEETAEGSAISDATAMKQLEEYWEAGRLLARSGMDDAYYVMMDKAWKLAAAKFGEDSIEYGQASNHMIGAFTGQKRIADAVYVSREAIRVNTIHFGLNSTIVANDRANLAARLNLLGEVEEAKSEWQAAIATYEALGLSGREHAGFSAALNGYSQYLSQINSDVDAVKTAMRAVKILEENGLTKEIDYGWALANAAYIQRAAGHCSESRLLFKLAEVAFRDAGVSATQGDYLDAQRMALRRC